MSPALLVLTPFLAPLLIWPARRAGRGATLLLAAAALIACLAGLALHLPAVLAGEAVRSQTPLPGGLSFSLRLEAAGFVFLLALLVGALAAAVQSRLVFERGPVQARFLSVLLLMTGAVSGLILADTVALAGVCWALAALLAALMIARAGDVRAGWGAAGPGLAITLAGGAAFTFGLAQLGGLAGSSGITMIAHRGKEIAAAGGGGIAVALILGGAIAAAGLVPFRIGQTRALPAPAPAAGFVLLALPLAVACLLLRLAPALAEGLLWTPVLVGFGLVSWLAGAISARRRHGLAGVAAALTGAQIGLIFLLTGLAAGEAVVPVVAALIPASLVLHLTAGLIRRETGRGSLILPGGLINRMPWTALAALIAALSLAAITPLAGYHALLGALEVASGFPQAPMRWLSGAGIALGLALSVAAGLNALRLAAAHPEPEAGAPVIRDPRWPLLAVPYALAALLVVTGIRPALIPLGQGPFWPGPENPAAWLWLAALGLGFLLDGLLPRRALPEAE
ncbi:hypothetical protein [Pseudogemmobacter humi]|uniref:Na(+)/H(+) antiporter subunit A n=1 Tax=Pseudogemmobacter humi TaxID=2483812 RepID=A0A3P5X189_9RHOB|nr:hypothetical protein [Pseudogemmobacter humi]VDC28050.1 Na(+)/H(+) antiporter subunit A [Pseudogemmobacter humi]